MGIKKIIVQHILCTPIIEQNSEAQGFNVKGYKDLDIKNSDAKLGFILSGVKILSFQQVAISGVRTRVKYIPSGFEIRQEVKMMNAVVGRSQSKNNVIFINRDDQSVVVMQGEPTIQDKTFIGQMISVEWDEKEIHIVPLQQQNNFHCNLHAKNNRIDCLIR